jgi:hypothetical protein
MKNRKRFQIGFMIYLSLIIIALGGMVISSYMRMHPNIKVGQVWVKEYDTDNPYKEVRRDTIVIIDVKDDYCLYVNKNTGDTISDTKHWAIVCARKIKKGDK